MKFTYDDGLPDSRLRQISGLRVEQNDSVTTSLLIRPTPRGFGRVAAVQSARRAAESVEAWQSLPFASLQIELEGAVRFERETMAAAVPRASPKLPPL